MAKLCTVFFEPDIGNNMKAPVIRANTSLHIALQPGQIVSDKYRIESVLGSGGMGTVYRAVQMAISRPMAIKLLHQQYLNDSAAIERFHREANLAGTVASDNICEVTDFGMLNNQRPFIVMPLLRGCTLKHLLTAEPISISRALDIVQQALLALQAVHDAGILHRDLKPENIFITQMGDRNDFVKLLDFGISKMMDVTSALKPDPTSKVTGTLAYMAPEQLCGAAEAVATSDLYAMGVILYELLTGRRPHQGNASLELAQQILEAPYPPPRKINPAIPKELEKIVIKALSKDPRDRFPSAESFRVALSDKSGSGKISKVNDLGKLTENRTEAKLSQTTNTTATMTVSNTIMASYSAPQNESSGFRSPFTDRQRRYIVPVIWLLMAAFAVVVTVLGIYSAKSGAAVSSLKTTLPAKNYATLLAPTAPAIHKSQMSARSTTKESPIPEVIPAPLPISENQSAQAPKSKNSNERFKKKKFTSLQQPKTFPSSIASGSGLIQRNKSSQKIKGRFQTEIISEYPMH